MKLRGGLPIAMMLALATAAQAQDFMQISAGTGFVVNRDGNIVTNAHVVRDCQSINIRLDSGDVQAEILASDKKHDLAVLHIPNAPDSIAPMRWNINELRVGDSVVVMGFPGQDGVKGRHHYKKTTVTNLAGPTGESQWIQLASVAEHGNSGGPVLDTSGNVIAVISGMAMTYKVDRQGNTAPRLVGQSDVAIMLAALQSFLQENRIPFYESSSGMVAYADRTIESQAQKFIVPVHCVQGVVSH